MSISFTQVLVWILIAALVGAIILVAIWQLLALGLGRGRSRSRAS